MKRAFNLFLIACMLLQSVPVMAGNDMGQGGQDQSQGQGGSLLLIDTVYDASKDGKTTQGDPSLFSVTGQEEQGTGGKDIGGNQQQQQTGGADVVIKPNPCTDVHQTPNPGNMVNYGQTYVFNSIAEYNAWARRQNEMHSNDPKDQARRRIEEARRRQELAQRQREQARRQQELARLQEQARQHHQRHNQQQQQQGGSYQAPENEMDLQWRRDLLQAQLERERIALAREQQQQQWAMQQQAQERQWQMQQQQIQREEQARRDAARAQQTMVMAQMFGMMIPMIVMASQAGKTNSSSSGNYQYQSQPYPYQQQQYPGGYYQMGK